MNWEVYILECNDGSYYTGITTDLIRRIDQHRKGKGAKYTRAKGVKSLLWSVTCRDKSAALKLEVWIKGFSRERKENFIKNTIFSEKVVDLIVKKGE